VAPLPCVTIFVDIDQSVNGFTLLGAACQAPCPIVAVAVTSVLLSRSADVNVGSAASEWLLDKASSNLRVARVRNGESKSEKQIGWFAQLPLKLASATGHTEVVSLLIKAGAKTKDSSGPGVRLNAAAVSAVHPLQC
jgi:hypothetical protein